LNFEDLYLSDELLDAIEAMHFRECTPIQEQSIPVIQDGRDLIAVAQTGTGKTAAYLLPVIDEIAFHDYSREHINCLVIAPTRELVQQIDQQMQGFSYFLDVSCSAIYGGTDGKVYGQQKQGLAMGADVVIGTPGRLLAHMSMGYVDLSHVSFLILDEADRMLDMGFYDDIMQIVNATPRSRQTLLFSATMPPKIKKLAKSILNDPVEVKIAVSKPAEKIDQRAYICPEEAKTPLLCRLFANSPEGKRVIVFASSKLKVKDLARTLRRMRLNVAEMHSDLEQNEREEVMLGFKSGRTPILVATDIVARGIDIDDIAMVVNYDVPHDPEDYIHRIGRTARADAEGTAITLVSGRDSRRFREIESFLGKPLAKDPLPDDLAAHERKQGDADRRRRPPRKKKPDTVQARKPAKPQEKAAPENAAATEKPKDEASRKRRRPWRNHRRGKQTPPAPEKNE